MLRWTRSGLRHCLGGDIGETSDCAQAASSRFSLPPDQVTERRFAAAANAVEASDLGDRTTRGAHDVGKDMPWWPLLPGKNARNEIGGEFSGYLVLHQEPTVLYFVVTLSDCPYG